MLRTIIENLNNVTFLYYGQGTPSPYRSGSKRQMMLDIFSGERNPFYRSTEFLTLQKLEHNVYSAFIGSHFREKGIGIEDETIDYILDWTRTHTYWTRGR